MEGVLEDLERCAKQAADHHVHFFVSHQAHFLDPLVPGDRRQLENAPLSPSTVEVARRVVEQEIDPASRRARIYFPVPMARGLDAGASWDEVAASFRYDMIVVDEEQAWSWRGRPVADRTRDFFLQYLSWAPAVERWFFEYKIHDGWWDKSYLAASITPLRAVRFEFASGSEDESGRLVLQDGRRAECRFEAFRLDERERLFVDSVELGEVLVSDAERFRLLRTADETMQSVDLGPRRVPLIWPASIGSGGPSPGSGE